MRAYFEEGCDIGIPMNWCGSPPRRAWARAVRATQ